jgi:predicted regulator of Ras-like GTPase activity (Roadblock/LC7/MglB family)
MTVSIDLDDVLNNLVAKLGSDVFFVLITSENGVVIKSYINEDEFNKASISLNVSQLYELAEEVTTEIGLHSPDFNIIHSSSYYIVSIKILGKIVVLLTQDQVEISYIFKVINESVGSQ